MITSTATPISDLPIAAAIADRSGAIVETNAAFVQLFGPGRKEGPWRLADLVPGKDGTASGALVSVWRADGSVVEALAFAGPADGGKLVLTFADITERAERERRLHELSLFPLMNPSPVLRFDRDGRVVLANPAAERLFGNPPLAGRAWTELCPGMTPALWESVLKTTGPFVHEVMVGTEEVRWAHVHAAGGEFVTAFGQVVTDLRRAQREIEEKARQVAEIARFPDMNPGPVIRTDADGNVLLANAAAREVFGEALAGGNWLKICPAVGPANWPQILKATGTVPIEARIGGRDWMFTHRRDHQTELVFIYGADVTHQKRTEVALRQSEKMATLGTLSAGVAHELNNPAAATRRAADQFMQKLTLLEDAHRHLSPAVQSPEAKPALDALLARASAAVTPAQPLDAMTQSDRETEMEDWLQDRGVPEPWAFAGDLVNAGIGVEALEPLAEKLEGDDLTKAIGWITSAFNVRSLAYVVGQGAARISEIVGALKGYAYLGQAPIQEIDVRDGIENTLIIMRSKLKYGINVHRDYAEDLPPIPAWGSELNQVWTNLIDNAADAMGGKGDLFLRTRLEEPFAVVEIEDNGPGIPAEARSRVFDPFFTTKPPGKGLGLGLSTTYSIVVDKHHGEISVDSQPGKTRFTVKLPLRQAAAAATTPAE